MNANVSHTFGIKDSSFKASGGEQGIRQLVDSFYDLMSSDDRFATIYALHPQNQPVTRDKLSRFLCGWLGGPKLYNQTYGSIAIPSAHAHLPITEAERDQWLTCMSEAVEQQSFLPQFKTYLMEQLQVPAEAIRKRCAQKERDCSSE